MFEEMRQTGAVSRAYYGNQHLGEEHFHDAPLDYNGQLNETYFTKAVENFQIFYAGILTVIFILFPNALFKKQFDAGLAFQAGSIEELRFQIIEREMGKLTYKGLLDLVSDVQKITGFSMFETMLQAPRAARAIEIRNLLVHNRGIVNSRYISGSRNKSLVAGRPLNVPSHLSMRNWFSLEARKMDHRLREKFSIPEDYLRWRND